MLYYKHENTYYQKDPASGDIYAVTTDENDIPQSGATSPKEIPNQAKQISTLPPKVQREIDQVIRHQY